MTTDAFTTAAFESAASKYQGDWDSFEQEPVDDSGLSESERRAHVAGWEAARDHLAQQNTLAEAIRAVTATAPFTGQDVKEVAQALQHIVQEPTDAEVLAALNADYAIRFGPRNLPADRLEPYGDEAVRIMRAALSAARKARR